MNPTLKPKRHRLVFFDDLSKDWIFRAGKHKDEDFSYVSEKAPDYLVWLLENVADLPLPFRSLAAEAVGDPSLAELPAGAKECPKCGGTGFNSTPTVRSQFCKKCGGSGVYSAEAWSKLKKKPSIARARKAAIKDDEDEHSAPLGGEDPEEEEQESFAAVKEERKRKAKW